MKSEREIFTQLGAQIEAIEKSIPEAIAAFFADHPEVSGIYLDPQGRLMAKLGIDWFGHDSIAERGDAKLAKCMRIFENLLSRLIKASRASRL